jgi:membrane-bound lytic murein transglycosylase B
MAEVKDFYVITRYNRSGNCAPAVHELATCRAE